MYGTEVFYLTLPEGDESDSMECLFFFFFFFFFLNHLTNFDCPFSVLMHERFVAWRCTGLLRLELVDNAVDEELHKSA